MGTREWTPLMLLAEINRLRRLGQCPTVEELARAVDLGIDQVQQLLDVLIDRRYVVIDSGRIYPWGAGPSPVVTYKLSPEEIAARYGPPAKSTARAKTAKHDAKEAAEMPKGQPIDWPSNEELVAMADDIAARGGDVLAELSERIGCSPLTVKTRLRFARAAVRGQTASEQARDAMPGPESASDPGTSQDRKAEATTPEPAPGELMQMAEAEAASLVEASRSPQKPDSEKRDTSAYPETDSGSREAQEERNTRALVLLGYCAPDSPPPVIVEQDTLERAPERPGDEWAELVRVNGRRTYRLWRCVAVLPDGAAILLPIDAAIVQVAAAAVPRTA